MCVWCVFVCKASVCPSLSPPRWRAACALEAEGGGGGKGL